MTPEEIKTKLALTDEQKELIKKFQEIVKEMKENHIGIIFDTCVDQLSFAAFNEKEVLEIGDKDWMNQPDNAVEVEDFLVFGNIMKDSIYDYNSYFCPCYAVFGDKSTENASAMSAQL